MLDKIGQGGIIYICNVSPATADSFILPIYVVTFKATNPTMASQPVSQLSDDDFEIAIHHPAYSGYMFSVNASRDLHHYITHKSLYEGETVVVYCHRVDDTAVVWFIDRATGQPILPPKRFACEANAKLQISVCMRAKGAHCEIVPTVPEDFQARRLRLWRGDSATAAAAAPIKE